MDFGIMDFNEIAISKESLAHNDKVLIVDICEYSENNQVVAPYIATVKLSYDKLYWEFQDDNSMLFDDDYRYIVVKKL